MNFLNLFRRAPTPSDAAKALSEHGKQQARKKRLATAMAMRRNHEAMYPGHVWKVKL